MKIFLYVLACGICFNLGFVPGTALGAQSKAPSTKAIPPPPKKISPKTSEKPRNNETSTENKNESKVSPPSKQVNTPTFENNNLSTNKNTGSISKTTSTNAKKQASPTPTKTSRTSNNNASPVTPTTTSANNVQLQNNNSQATTGSENQNKTPKANTTDSESFNPEAEKNKNKLNLKLRKLESRVNSLKEKIFQSKARLVQLQEAVLHGTIMGSKAVIIHRNEMGSSFRLARVQYSFDGTPIFNRVDDGSGELDDLEEIEIYNGSIAPGNHQISVYLEYQGYGYGVFSYLQGYKFKIKSSYTLSADDGIETTIRVVGYEKGGITTKLKDRPAVRYDLKTSKIKRKKRELKNKKTAAKKKKTPPKKVRKNQLK